MRRRPDTELIVLARKGSKEAAEALFERYWVHAWRAAYAVTADRALADDAAQEGMEKAFASLDRFDETRPFAPWLKRITVNRAIDHLRRGRRLEPLHDEDDDVPRVVARRVCGGGPPAVGGRRRRRVPRGGKARRGRPPLLAGPAARGDRRRPRPPRSAPWHPGLHVHGRSCERCSRKSMPSDFERRLREARQSCRTQSGRRPNSARARSAFDPSPASSGSNRGDRRRRRRRDARCRRRARLAGRTERHRIGRADRARLPARGGLVRPAGRGRRDPGAAGGCDRVERAL